MPYGRSGTCLLWHRAESNCNYSLLINSSARKWVAAPSNGCGARGSHPVGNSPTSHTNTAPSSPGRPQPSSPHGQGHPARAAPQEPHTPPSSCPHKQLSYTRQPTPAAPSGSDLWPEPPALLNQLINPQLLPAMVKGQSNRKKARAAFPETPHSHPADHPSPLQVVRREWGQAQQAVPKAAPRSHPLMLAFRPPPSASPPPPRSSTAPGGLPAPSPAPQGPALGVTGGPCIHPAANGSKRPRVWEGWRTKHEPTQQGQPGGSGAGGAEQLCFRIWLKSSSFQRSQLNDVVRGTSVFLSIRLSIHPSTHPSTHPSLYLPIHPSTYLSIGNETEKVHF